MTCTITQKGLGMDPIHFYHYLRGQGYKHRSAVISTLMYYSPNKEDLSRRVRRRREYYKEAGQ